ncbi:purine-cytosine permease family protein [Streptomyces spectabilis]|uniref:Nitrate reductase n=1 Tax=Streptomyces spectabilis TaxID=68270 RepID=A0A5P2XKQ5_STRST|nr:cytosine permease [Streptomyces spectabilis]MBB5102503.1 purine-cytosine permease-like protein [Streptomyces spectabilis]MCI3907543.1 cytosine permease [Streptomyces spectabilis]QEV64234.1 nitrate reductase [Streptomyces spectabilis]GGV31475.1 allantoin permease [Streptomyces spectabilis]
MASTLPDPHEVPLSPRTAHQEAPPPTGGAGRIEAHGIDHIPEQERHGHPRRLFSVWAAANVNYLSLIVGGTLVLMGLTLWQALAVIVTGNLFWSLTGLLAVSGPAAGAPSEVITRAMYGIRGNRVNNAVVGWMISVAYFALNLAAAATAAFSLVEKTGATASTGVKVVVVLAIAALTLTIGVYGHATIMKLYLPITLALAAVFAVVAVCVFRRADYAYAPVEPLTGAQLWAVLISGVTLVGAAPLSYTTSADFSRYLPRTTSAKAVLGWTALGGFLPGVVVCSLGALAATAVDMADPQAGLQGILPGWFDPVFLLALVLGTIALNALTSYSAGLALQAVGIRIRRSLSVIADGTAAVSLTLYALLVSDFLDTVSNVLQLTVVLLGPATAVYATDILLRRNRYDGRALMDETRAGPFWYTAGVNPAGALALAGGVTAAALCVDTLYTGPVAGALGGMDLSLPVGIVVASSLYTILTRATGRCRDRG